MVAGLPVWLTAAGAVTPEPSVVENLSQCQPVVPGQEVSNTRSPVNQGQLLPVA